ncbi:MAG TPA: ABC transporter permease subunit [Anaerolineae bacterium]|jgi:ABC-2 type transport system permease protein|nr:ABC transporter permease subunit [Anaerolineae bacterium]
MKTIFQYSLKKFRGQILGWGLGLAFLAAILVLFYDTIAAEQEQFQQLLDAYPPEMLAFFGGALDLLSPSGFLGMYFFAMMPIIMGIFAVMAGSGLLVADEENGTLDLVMAHPVSRTGLFAGRLLAIAAALAGILVLGWLGFALLLPFSSLEVNLGHLAAAMLSLGATQIFFAALALLLSLLLPSRKTAAAAAGLALISSYFASSLANLNEGLETLAELSPLTYYQGAGAFDGIEWGWLAALTGLAALMALLAWRLFERRDIRVGGEGGWRLPKPRLRRERSVDARPALSH